MGIKDELLQAQDKQTDMIDGKNYNGLHLLDLSNYTDVAMFKPGIKGTFRLDILPWRCTTNNYQHVQKGGLAYVLDLWIHQFVGVHGDTVPCNKKNGRGACVVCEEASRLWDEFKKGGETDKVLEEKARGLFARRRAIYNAIDTSDPGKGIQIFNTSFANFHEQLERQVGFSRDEGEIIIIADYEDGKSIKFSTFEDSGKGYTFANFTNFSFEARTSQYDESILDQVFPFDTLITNHSYEFVEARFYGREEEAEGAPADDVEAPIAVTTVTHNGVPVKTEATKVAVVPATATVETKAVEAPVEMTREERMAEAKAKKAATAEAPVGPVAPMACPSGHKFGHDNWNTEECADCEHNEACDVFYKELKAAGLVT